MTWDGGARGQFEEILLKGKETNCMKPGYNPSRQRDLAEAVVLIRAELGFVKDSEFKNNVHDMLCLLEDRINKDNGHYDKSFLNRLFYGENFI